MRDFGESRDCISSYSAWLSTSSANGGKQHRRMTGSVSSLLYVAGHLLVFSAFQYLPELSSPALTMHLLLFPGKLLCPLNTHRPAGPAGPWTILHDFKHEALCLWLPLPLPPTTPLLIFTSLHPHLAPRNLIVPILTVKEKSWFVLMALKY